jgi:hypothetical protein
MWTLSLLVAVGAQAQPVGTVYTGFEVCGLVSTAGGCVPGPTPNADVSPFNPRHDPRTRRPTGRPPVDFPPWPFDPTPRIPPAASQSTPPVFTVPWVSPPDWRTPLLPDAPAEIERDFVKQQLADDEPQARSAGRTAGSQVNANTPGPTPRVAREYEQQQRPSSDPPLLPVELGGPRQPSDGTGDPVNPGTGGFRFENVDLSFSGIGFPFEFVRRYRSGWSKRGSLGFGWSHNFEQRIVPLTPACGTDDVYDWETGRNAIIRFLNDGRGRWVSETGTTYRLESLGPDHAIVSPDGITHVFRRADGVLSEIRDLNGNRQILTWRQGTVPGSPAPALRLEQIVDTVGRTITLSYEAVEMIGEALAAGLGPRFAGGPRTVRQLAPVDLEPRLLTPGEAATVQRLIGVGGTIQSPAAKRPTINTSLVRFIQNSVSSRFSTGQTLNDTIAALRGTGGDALAERIPAIRVFEFQGQLYTLDNRRLLVFSHAERDVPFTMVDATTAIATEIKKKGTTTAAYGWGRFITVLP